MTPHTDKSTPTAWIGGRTVSEKEDNFQIFISSRKWSLKGDISPIFEIEGLGGFNNDKR